MQSCLIRIVKKDISCRSLRCEILNGKKRLPFKYIFPYKDDPVIVSAYKDYLFNRELNRFCFSSQTTLEDFL